jgi:Protein of unknown function (DUF3106)
MPANLASRRPADHLLPLMAALSAAMLSVLVSFAWVHQAHAANPEVSIPAPTSPTDKSWQLLSPQEKAILAPLASQWPAMNDQVREKWRSVARGYPKLSPDAQARVRERMTGWSSTPPKERSEARLRFQNARELPQSDRQQKWQAYQALSPQAKAELAQQAKLKKETASQAANALPVRDSTQGSGNKTNVVPAPAATAPTPRAVAPALVKAGPGATTSLVTQSAPKPPLHQQAGMPKIAATKTFVDPQTLLPKKGSQGAAMTPVPAQAAPKASN